MRGRLGFSVISFSHLCKEIVFAKTCFASSIYWVTNNEVDSMSKEKGMQFGADELGYV